MTNKTRREHGVMGLHFQESRRMQARASGLLEAHVPSPGHPVSPLESQQDESQHLDRPGVTGCEQSR